MKVLMINGSSRNNGCTQPITNIITDKHLINRIMIELLIEMPSFPIYTTVF